jgi:PAS domain S-box-containing protein
MKTTPRSLKGRYIFFIGSVVLTIIATQAIIQYDLQRQNQDAHLINTAGRQRMLSQRISKLILYLKNDIVETGAIRFNRLDTLRTLVDGWENVHHTLINQNKNNAKSKAIDSLLQLNTSHLAAIATASRNILETPTLSVIEQAVDQITTDELPFLLLMEKTVDTYQYEAEQKLYYLKKIELALSGLAVAILIFEFIYIFLPVLNRLRANNKKLSRQANALVKSEKLYRLLSENTKDLICLYTPEVRYKFISASVERITGYSTSEFLGQEIYRFIHPEDRDRLQKGFSGIASGSHDVRSMEYRMVRKDGASIWMEAYIMATYTETGIFDGFQMSSRDITQRKKTEEALMEAKEKAETAAKTKGEFLSMISHEIRTPMNAIIGLTNLLLEEKRNNGQSENLKLLKFSGENLLTIINDILDFSKIEANKIEINAIDFDLKEIVQRMIKMMEYHAFGKNVKVSAQYDNDLPQYFKGDPVRITQIITNLMGNAVKFTLEGEVILTIKKVKNTGSAVTLYCSVSDTGIGIHPENIESIFDSFSQAGDSSARKFGGTGLGLTITRKLLRLMDSDIAVESILGKGSKFYFTLTLEQGEKPLEEETANSGLVTMLKNRNIRVLLVEDNRVNQIVAINFLQSWGIHTVVASNGKEALELILEKRYDLVLMDLQMPVMNGYDATRAIRALDDLYFKNIPIIALTASAMIEMRDKVMMTGMTDYMSKPFHPGDLQRIIAKYILNGEFEATPVSISNQLDLYTEGNIEFKRELIRQFIDNLEELKSVFEKAITEKSADIFRAAVHKSKTTVSVINHKPLSEAIHDAREKMTAVFPGSDSFPDALRIQFYKTCDEAVILLKDEMNKTYTIQPT